MEKKEPNKLLIIGNGFDRAHKLETGYEHFMLWVLKKEFNVYFEKSDPLEILDFSKTPNRSDGDTFQNYSLTEFQDFFFINNPHANLLELPRGISNSEQLKQYYIAFKKNSIGIKNDLFRHLLFQQKLQTWVNVEDEFYKILVKFFKNEVSLLEFKSFEKFNVDFEQIKSLLEKYLSEICNEPYDEIKKIADFFDSLPKVYNRAELNPNFIVNFNYTYTPYKYIEDYMNPEIDQICYIHGELEAENNPIVFGYGDEKEDNYLPMEKSKNDNYLKHIKSFAYLRTYNYSRLLQFIESGEYEVFILGHSCGQSDRVLLKTIFEHDNCKEIIIKYYLRPDGTNDFDEKAKEIARSFTDKALFRKRVAHYQDERVTSLR